MSEDSFARLNSTMSSFVRSIDLEQEEPASRPGAVGPLFHSSNREGQTRINTRGAGAKPSGTFIWLSRDDPTDVDLTSLEGKRGKFSRNMSSDAMLTLLKREIPEIGMSSTISYFKSRSSGNHALFHVGNSLSGSDIVANYRYSATRVYIAQAQETPEDVDHSTDDSVIVVNSSVAPIIGDDDRLIPDETKRCIKGHFGPKYYEDGTTVGVIMPDKSDHGLYHPGLLHTSQVQSIDAALRHANVSGLPFVGISFDCLCQHINCGLWIALVFITNKAKHLTIDETDMLRNLCDYYISQRVSGDSDPLIWITSKDSLEGATATQELGSHSLCCPQLLICTPSLRGKRAPMPVETFSGTFIACEFSDAIEKAKETIQVVMLNRAKKEQETALKLQQEKDHGLALRIDASKQCRTRTNQLCGTQTNSNDIEIVTLDDSPLKQEKPETDDEVINVRLLRSTRLLPEDPKGVKVKVHTPIGMLQRRFNRNAFYQEVYDWLGCNEDLPLYFVLVCQTQNGLDLCYPNDNVGQDGEVLKLLEKDEEGMKTMTSRTEVTFCSTFPQLSDLNSTVESPGAGLGKDGKKRVREETADLETKNTKRAKQIKTNIATDSSTSQLKQNDGGTASRRKRRRHKEKERKNQTTTEKTE